MGDRTDRLSQVVEALPAVLFDGDPSANCLWVNPEWSRVTGQPLEEALGLGWTRRVHPDDTSIGLTLLLDLVRAPREASFDVRIQRADGSWCRMRTQLRPRLEGREVIGFSGVALELATDEEINRLEAHSEAVVAALPDLLFQIDASGTFVSFRGPPGVEPFVPPEQFIGKPLRAVLPGPITEATLEAMLRARDTGLVQRFEYALPASPGGEPRDYEARVTAMRTGDFVVLVRDVTERKGFEAELVAAREHAITSDRHKTQFLANVSHEIRTPLNSILGVTQLLRSWALPPEAGEYLDLLQTGADSLLGIVDDVLDLSKIEANRLELSTQSFDAEKTIVAAVKVFTPLAQKKGIALEIHAEPSVNGTVLGDPLRLRQIVNNLVGNAVKFTDRGQVRVRVARDGRTGLVTLRVSDTGPGIAPEMHQRIFEPFVQTEGTQRRFGGTGLGLSITQRLARLMGGDIRVESSLGAGTEFTALLDLPPVVPETELVSRSWRTTPPPRALAVLLAEDNEVNAAMTSALVGKLGHRVEVVGNGQEAVEAVRRRAFDLVLMDVQMPVLDGLQATRVIREGERGTPRHLPIVALTANAMKGDDLLCLSAGMDAYLPKPVTVEALKDMLMWFGSA